MLANKSDIRARYEYTIATLGVPATVTSVSSGSSVDCVIGWKSTNDEELIAAFGVGTKVATVRQCDVPVVEKMDKINVQSDRYTINEVFPVYLNDLLVGWRCVIRGK